MNEIKDGGPAFPVADPFALRPVGEAELKRIACGMTLRDWLAGLVMQSLLRLSLADLDEMYPEADGGVSTAAYLQADAMLRARDGL